MPIYEYKCDICKNIFEELIVDRSSNSNTAKCPKCNNYAKKTLSAANFDIRGYSEKNGYSRKKE